MKRSVCVLAIAGLALIPLPSSAAETGRYVLKDVEGGFIRLDTETGAVAHCRAREGEWRCDTVADDRRALQDQITALHKENSDLKHRVAELEAELLERPDPKSGVELPSDQELDKVFGFFEKLMRRFIDLARTLKEESGEKI